MINILLIIGAFIFMECVAWFTHKYVMHGLLWTLHKDHHQKDEDGFFEKNDYFFLIFAIPAMVLFIIGGSEERSYLLWIAVGITLYGAAYFLVHDVFIHQRFKLFRNTKNIYLLAIRRAHKMHHKHLDRKEGECFGMLFVPFKYYRQAIKTERNNEN